MSLFLIYFLSLKLFCFIFFRSLVFDRVVSGCCAPGVFPVAYTGRLRQKGLGTSFRLQVYEMKVVARGFIQVEEYEMIGKSVIEICERTEKG